MPGRSVPFLLNAAPAQADTWTDRILWTLAGYFRHRRFSGFDRLFSAVESIIDFGGTPAIWLSIGRRNIVLLNMDEQQTPTGFVHERRRTQYFFSGQVL